MPAPDPTINPMYEYFYSSQFLTYSIVSRIAAILSFFGSSAIVYDVIKKKALQSTANRLVFLMSICDIIWGFAIVLGTLPMPRGAAWGAYGTWASCYAQGFVIQLCLEAACFLNANLAIYYVICVRLGWREEQFRRPLVQIWLYGFPFLLGLINCIWALVDGAFTVVLAACEFGPNPLGCNIIPDIVGECTSGIHADVIAGEWTIMLLLFSAVIAVSVIILYWTVLQKERATDRFRPDGQVSRNLSNRVAMQGIYYAICFLLTYIFFYVYFFGYKLQGKAPPTWLLMGLGLIPMQGLFNALVYFRRNSVSDSEQQGLWGSIRNSVMPRFSKMTSRLSISHLKNTSSRKLANSSSGPRSRLSFTAHSSQPLSIIMAEGDDDEEAAVPVLADEPIMALSSEKEEGETLEKDAEHTPPRTNNDDGQAASMRESVKMGDVPAIENEDTHDENDDDTRDNVRDEPIIMPVSSETSAGEGPSDDEEEADTPKYSNDDLEAPALKRKFAESEAYAWFVSSLKDEVASSAK